MTKYLIEIDTDNAAFDEGKAHELASILDTLVEKLESGRGYDFTLRDTNGNKVGTAYMEESEDEEPFKCPKEFKIENI